jgi:hypothetical protein
MNSTSDPTSTGAFAAYERTDGGGGAAIDNPTDGQCYVLGGGAESVKKRHERDSQSLCGRQLRP